MLSIEEIKREYESLLQQLSDPELISDSPASNAFGVADAGWEKLETLTKRRAFLEKILAKEKEIGEIKNKIEENKSIVAAKEDLELSSLAEAEINQLLERQGKLQKELESLLKNGAEEESRTRQNFASRKLGGQAVILEIRAGTGGQESALFAADLFRMYSRYAERHGWKEKILDSRQSELAGLKEVIFELKNGDVFSQMKYEGGVHRVQRIPITEKSGRIHTSTATVAVLPKPKKTDIKINPQDLKTDFYRSSGPGGQYVNKRETAVRITHVPTGLVVTSQTERNQLQNKENALAILEARLSEKKEMEYLEKMGEKRKAQIKWAKRAEKIRTYNFPQDRVTDHRVKKNFHDIEGIMAGKLDPIVEALKKSGE